MNTTRFLTLLACSQLALPTSLFASVEAGFTIERAKVEAMKARLLARLREHFQRRDRLRLVIRYRRKYLESLVRQGEEEAGKIAQEYRQASAQSDREYAETAAALDETNWDGPRLTPMRSHHRRALSCGIKRGVIISRP